jgi:hypothetical protein
MIAPHLDMDSELSTFPVSRMDFNGNSNGILTPKGPVIVYTAEPDLVIIDQTAIDEGELFWDYTSAYADYQNEVARNENPYGLSFWGYPIEENSDNESREFYNTVDGTPYNQDVFTRSKKKFNTFVNTLETYNVQDENGNWPVKFAYILAEDINSDVDLPATPFLISNIRSVSQWQQAFLQLSDFDDSTLPNVANARSAVVDGSNRYADDLDYSTVNQDNHIIKQT